MLAPVALAFVGLFAQAASSDHRVVVENDLVRILSVVDTPGRKSALHKHDVNRVMIYLDAGAIDLVYADGRKDEQRFRAGQVLWSPTGAMHTSENVGRAPTRIVEIELKQPGPAVKPTRARELDPVATDPEHNDPIFENAQVRVFRSWREAGGTERMHEHTGRGRASVLLTDAYASVRSKDGGVTELSGKPATVFWSGPVTHATTNKGANRMEMIVVEVF